MEIRVQKSSSARAGNGVLTHPDGSRTAILFLRAGNAEAMAALGRVYSLHEAPVVEMALGAPDQGESAGECVIHDEGVTVTLGAVDPSARNGGHGMLGLELTVSWGETSPVWKQTALDAGDVWAGLLTEEAYERICAANAAVVGDVLGQDVHLTQVPTMPVLRLSARYE
ncbi:hypothetical protein ACFW2V_12445 [Streptomyces sp. NPDC058947]|uniref:hypothetical protein n=1 Tax=Streptomyces sp. NPDC058947 TaxID=3346675 RepID=UPI00368B33A7